jgi:hypothetical protein
VLNLCALLRVAWGCVRRAVTGQIPAILAILVTLEMEVTED